MNIEPLKDYVNEGNIIWTTHCLQRMGERDIKRADVKNCILTGEIIELYPNDFPNPSYLVFGQTLNNKCLHAIVSCNNKNMYVITAYYPSTDKFEADLKTRRK